MTNLVGQSIGRYRITRLIGEGGMVVVFKGRDIYIHPIKWLYA